MTWRQKEGGTYTDYIVCAWYDGVDLLPFADKIKSSYACIHQWVCEFGGLEWWNGMVEWTTGVPRPQVDTI